MRRTLIVATAALVAAASAAGCGSTKQPGGTGAQASGGLLLEEGCGPLRLADLRQNA